MPEQKGYVDFDIGLGDTGQDNITSIQPVNTDEAASQDVLRRPSENLRERTETLRDQIAELLYYRDAAHMYMEYTGGTVEWKGVAGSPAGRIVVTGGTFRFSPFLAPGTAAKGSLSVGVATDNQVIYTVQPSAYATQGMNAITVEHRDGGSGASLSATISPGPVKRILVVFDSTNTAHDAAATLTALAAAIAGDALLNGKIAASINADPGIAIAAIAETRLDKTADDEMHVVTAADIQTLTTNYPLALGEGIAIWYKYVVEPSGGDGSDPKVGLAGGRAESSVSRGTSAIPAASLFITNDNPEKIPGAIPICRVAQNGELIWADGTRQAVGEITDFSSFATSTGAGRIGYPGSSPTLWRDTTGLAAGTVLTALNEIVSDLAAANVGNNGAARIGVDGAQFSGPLTAAGGGGVLTSATTIMGSLDQLDARVVSRRAFTGVFTDGSNSVGGDYDGATSISALFDGTLGVGHYVLRQGQFNVVNTAVSSTSGLCLYGLGAGETTVVVDSARASALDLTESTCRNLHFAIASAASADRLSLTNAKLFDCHLECNAVSTGDAQLNLHAERCVFGPENPLTAGTNYQIQRPGFYKKCIFNKPANAVSFNVSVAISATYARDSLVFEDCVFYGGVEGSSLRALVVSSFSGAALIFRGCLFTSTDATSTATLVDAGSGSQNVIFEDCVFYNETGRLLRGTASGATFINCRFIMGPTRASVANTQAISIIGASAEQPARFINCSVIVDASALGNTVPTVEFGCLDGTPAAGNGNVHVNGLRISHPTSLEFPATSVMYRFHAGTSTSVENRPSTYRDVLINFQGAPITAASAFPIVEFVGTSYGMLEVNNLMIMGLENATGNFARNYVRISDGHLRTARFEQIETLLSTTQSAGTFLNLLNSVGEDIAINCPGIRFSQPVFVEGSSGGVKRARLDGLVVRGAYPLLTYRYVGALGYADVENVTYWGHASGMRVIYASGPYCHVSKNKIYTPTGTDTPPIEVDGANCVVSDNLIVGTWGALDVIRTTGANCVIDGNFVGNTGASVPTISSAGSAVVGDNKLAGSVAVP